jgi:hypothetical protein
VQSRVIALVIDKPPSSAFDLFLNIFFDLNSIAYGLSLYFRVLPIHGFGLRLREGGGGTATGGLGGRRWKPKYFLFIFQVREML